MPLTGTLLADFSSFQTEVYKSETALKSFEGNTTRTATSIDRLGVGGTNTFGTLQRGLSEADHVLAAFGIHIIPEIRALGEMSDAAGKTATEIGLIGTATFATAAAFAGWKIGRLIADFLDLDQSIGDATAKLLGLGDVAAETAGARMDVLSRASKTAGHAITDFNEAVKINSDELKRHQDSLFTAEQRATRYSDALGTLTTAVGSVTKEQAALILQGTALHQSVKDIADALGLQQASVQAVIDKDREHTAQMKEEQKAIDAATEAMAKLTKAQQDHINSIGDKLFGSDDIQKATDYAEAIGRIENVSHLSADAQQEVFDVMTKGIEALVNSGLATDDLTSKFEAFRLKATETARDAAAAFKAVDEAAKQAAADAAALAAMQAAALGASDIDQSGLLRFFQNAFSTGGINHPTATPRAYGGATQAGEPYWVGEKGPELFVPSSNGSIIPNGGGGGGGTQVINLVVDGRVLASVVNDVNTRSMKQGRKWPAA